MKNKYNRILFIFMDFFIFILMYYLCWFINGNFNFNQITQKVFFSLAIFSGIKVLINYVFKAYNHLWIYRNKHDFLRVSILSLVGNIVIIVINWIAKLLDYKLLKINVLVFCLVSELLYLYFSRILYSHFIKKINNYKNIDKTNMKKTMIVGAGSAGTMILNEIEFNPALKFNVIGFIDDDLGKIGSFVSNKKVYGPVNDLNKFTKQFMVTDLIIACPSAGKERIKEIVNSINYKDMNVMIMPEMTKVLQDKLNPTLRKVSIADLLGRKSINLDQSGINEFVDGKIILVTGAGGSIGSEICRQLVEYNPKLLIMFDIYENSVYSLITEFDIKYRDSGNKPKYKALIGSVRDYNRLKEIFAEFGPDIVFHAAAHKHVPLMEDSPREAIKNNVIGTYNVSKICNEFKVNKMVLISTDKAVNPTNVMGASKRFCELIVESFNKSSENTMYSMVRFGNVLGSNGSVVPLFQKQIEKGGPITVTHKDINRFFMTIPEACSLVIQSGVFAKGGEKFILDMGQPVKIFDLAKKMIQLSGLVLDKDIKIEITGLRPGEKLYEEILLDISKATKTDNEKIFVERNENPLDMDQIEIMIDYLKEISSNDNCNKEILDYLAKVETLTK